ncbi:NADH-quinone oxidoreductase subunit L [Candidatus Endowatersipora endosymbiont of Watersipora subatra]|uniref:NADH-quinone oxidoreductase subunit L n=1 Tax=Candidatus Endowatersipora endosymbiont of Watersipora subatra TaxID=3077946 RepID=UPI00312C9891
MIHLIVFLPLIGFLISGFFGRQIGHRGAGYLTSGLLVISAFLSFIMFIRFGFGPSKTQSILIMRWIQSGHLTADWSFRLDTLTTVMLVVVNTISSLVHIYSIGYMHNDPNRSRFFAYLSLFTFTMLMLVTSDNLIQMFFGWEGVGLASYLLIGFWFKKPLANAAAMKAFIVNRVGDFGFLLGIFGLFFLFDSIDFSTIFSRAASFSVDSAEEANRVFISLLGYDFNKLDAITVVTLFLFMGAMGKSAQFFLHVWLPDAMEGPTPVSALIHAATMVTAGVFLVARLSPIFELSMMALTVVTFFGAITAFFAATVGLVQNDIKRVIAYSTCSQLGYMFAALGVGAYGPAIFHLFTHAFFKALLFLGSGSVIHALSGEQDMRKMGGLHKIIPRTYWMMLIGTLALTGFGVPGTIIGTAGFFSKDSILASLYVGQNPFSIYAFWLTLIVVLFTSFYSWRLIFMTFHGKTRGSADIIKNAHESPIVMMVPLYILAIGSLFFGVFFYRFFVGSHHESGHLDPYYLSFWKESLFLGEENTILQNIHSVPKVIEWSPFIMIILGLYLSWQFYIHNPKLPIKLSRQYPRLYRFLFKKWYFDDLYDFLFVRTMKSLGYFLWKKGDIGVIDRLGPDGISKRVIDISHMLTKFQSGYLYHYAFAMVIGATALVTVMMFSGK